MAIVSSPMHLYRYGQVLVVCQDFSTRRRTGGGGTGPGFTPDLCIEISEKLRVSMKFYASKITKNACMDLHEMSSVDRCRNMDELTNF